MCVNKIGLLNEGVNLMSSPREKFAPLWEGHTSSPRGTAPPSPESEERSAGFWWKSC